MSTVTAAGSYAPGSYPCGGLALLDILTPVVLGVRFTPSENNLPPGVKGALQRRLDGEIDGVPASDPPSTGLRFHGSFTTIRRQR
jgi:hypothetical protein